MPKAKHYSILYRALSGDPFVVVNNRETIPAEDHFTALQALIAKTAGEYLVQDIETLTVRLYSLKNQLIFKSL